MDNKPRGLDRRDEELRSLRVGACEAFNYTTVYILQHITSIGHGEVSRGVVLDLEVLVREFAPVNAFAACCETHLRKRAIYYRAHSPVPVPWVKSPPWIMKSGITRWNLLPS